MESKPVVASAASLPKTQPKVETREELRKQIDALETRLNVTKLPLPPKIRERLLTEHKALVARYQELRKSIKPEGAKE